MDAIGTIIVVILNGLSGFLGFASNPLVAALIASGLSLLWFASMEVEQLDREANSKPEVGFH